MKNSTIPKPLQANQNNGTLKGPKQNHTNSSIGTKEKPSGLMPNEKVAYLGKGGKAC